MFLYEHWLGRKVLNCCFSKLLNLFIDKFFYVTHMVISSGLEEALKMEKFFFFGGRERVS